MTREVQEKLLDEVLPGWREAVEVRGERWIRCPLHDDKRPSLRLKGAVFYCDPCARGGGAWDLAQAVLGEAEARALLERIAPAKSGSNSPVDANHGTHLSEPSTTSDAPDLTLERYAEAKGLPIDFLRKLDLRTQKYGGGVAVRIPYLDTEGQEIAIRYRLQLEKGAESDGRFRWRTGSKVHPYGLWRLPDARKAGRLLLVEGESDAQSCWLHGVPALGLPGASTWKAEWTSHLDGFTTLYAVQEPGQGGETFIQRLLTSPTLHDRLRVVSLPVKDASALHMREGDGFKAALNAACAGALLAAQQQAERDDSEARERASDLWPRCADLAQSPNILELVTEVLQASGIAGDARLGRVTYLCVTSRLLKRPANLIAKGPSAAGKSFEVELAVQMFPESAVLALTAMSEHSLAYSEEPLAHRILLIYEATALEGDFASYLLRSLLSEGRIRYETVEKTDEGLRARIIEREGPTGAIVTTTRVSLHPENETRAISVPVDDTREQTQRILNALATGDERVAPDLDGWHALQEWLALAGERRVVIPFAKALARAVPPVAVRLRRDFGALLTLIRAHALLHQATRERDATGRIVATLEDYAEVRALVADLLGAAVEQTVPKSMRETVAAVAELSTESREPVSVRALATELKLDPSSASRRARAAVAAGYLRNLAEGRGKPARLEPGEPLPEERELLPEPEALESCTDAEAVREGVHDSTPRIDGENGEGVQSCSTDQGDTEYTHTRRLDLAPVDGVEVHVLGNGSGRRWQLRRDGEVLAETDLEDWRTGQDWIAALEAGRVPSLGAEL